MRKIDKKNKISFNVFGILIIAFLAVFAATGINVLKRGEQEYQVATGSVVYDESMSRIDMASPGTAKKKWDGKYYLSLENGGNYCLGAHSVMYDSGSRELSIIGDTHQVFTDGSIRNLSGKTVVENQNEVSFFKLDDRNYLMSAPDIKGEEQGFEAKDYVQINLDKSGNALLTNGEVNMKTVEPLVLRSGEVTFDIANELLIYREQRVDLKAINGSTNEYVPPEEPEIEEEEDEEDKDAEEDEDKDSDADNTAGGSVVNNTTNTNNTNNNDVTNNSQDVVVNGTNNGAGNNNNGAGDNNTNGTNNGTGDNNNGTNNGTGNNNNNSTNNGTGNNNNDNNNGTNNGTGNNNNNGTNNGAGDNNNNNPNNNPNNNGQVILDRVARLRGTTSDVTSVTVNYYIMDPENKYISTYLLVSEEGSEETQRIELSKADTSVTVRGLKPNTQYRIALGYDMYVIIEGESELSENIEDVVKARTKAVKSSVKIDKITADKIHFTVELDPTHLLDAANVCLYGDGEARVAQIPIDVKKASRGGFKGEFLLEDAFPEGSPSQYILTVEDAVYQGEAITLNAKCITKNSGITRFIDSLLRGFN